MQATLCGDAGSAMQVTLCGDAFQCKSVPNVACGQYDNRSNRNIGVLSAIDVLPLGYCMEHP